MMSPSSRSCFASHLGKLSSCRRIASAVRFASRYARARVYRDDSGWAWVGCAVGLRMLPALLEQADRVAGPVRPAVGAGEVVPRRPGAGVVRVQPGLAHVQVLLVQADRVGISSPVSVGGGQVVPRGHRLG